jgi:hypothetical protein
MKITKSYDAENHTWHTREETDRYISEYDE